MDLEQKYGKRYRIFLDESFKVETEKNKTENKWRYLEIRGKRGYVYPYSASELAVAVTGPLLAKRLRRSQPWRVIQDAEDVTVFIVPEENIKIAFSVIKPYYKKTLTDEEKANIADRLNRAREQKKSESGRDK